MEQMLINCSDDGGCGMILDQDKIERIKKLLKFHTRGLTISEISLKLKINRNSVAKYLEILFITGQVTVSHFGTAKVYSLTQRVPISEMLRFSSDFVIILDADNRILEMNENCARFFSLQRDEIIGRESSNTGDTRFNTFIAGCISRHPDLHTESAFEIPVTSQDKDIVFRCRAVPTVFEDGNAGRMFILEDITAQKEYELRLKESEAKYRAIVEDQTELICRWRPDGTITYVNEAFNRYFGKEGEFFIGKVFMPLISREGRTIAPGQTSPHGRMVVTYEHRVLTPNGVIRWQQWVDRAITLEDGTIVEYQSVGRDITDQKRFEGKIREYVFGMEYLAQAALRLYSASCDDDIYSLVAHGVKGFVPDARVQVYSYETGTGALKLRAMEGFPEGFIGSREAVPEIPDVTSGEILSWQHLHLVDYPPISISSSSGEGDGQVPEEVRTTYSIGLSWHQRPFGLVCIHQPSRAPIQNGTIIETYIRLVSVSLARRSSEWELQKSKELFKNTAALSQCAISLVTSEGSFVYVNQRFKDLFGYSAEEVGDTRHWSEMVYPDPEYRLIVDTQWKDDHEGIHAGPVRSRLYAVTCRDGQSRRILFRPIVMSDGSEFIMYEEQAGAEKKV